MPGQKISTLNDAGSLQSSDQLPLTRSGTSYSIKGSQFASKAQLDAVNSRIDSLTTNVSHGAHVGAITSNGLQTFYNEVVPSNKGGSGSINGILKADGSGNVTAAAAGVDYVTPTQLELKLTKPSSASNGQVLTFNNGTWVAADPPAGGGGEVTPTNLTGDVTSNGTTTFYNNPIPSAKGGAGDLAVGIVKANGNGTTSIAAAGTDYVVPSVLSNYATLNNLNGKLDKPLAPTNGDVLTFDGSAWIAKKPTQQSSIPNFGNDIITGFYLPPGTNRTWVVPSGLNSIEIIAQGSGGNGLDGITPGGKMVIIALPDASLILKPIKTTPILGTSTNVAAYDLNYDRGGGSGGTNKGGIILLSGGGAGGWCKKVLTVTSGQIFTYSCGTPLQGCTISSGSFTMIAGAGGNARDLGTGNHAPGVGGIVSGDFTEGYNGESGSTNMLGGRGRNLKGVLGGPGSEYSGYIFIKI
jgi:hypothetical protein